MELMQLNEALEYIENNLAGDISFDQAAKMACCSTYYFQRMFSYIAGVPLSEYIRRRRMTSAAFDLQNENAKISEIAAKYGYNSPTAFNRAFQSVHGVAPSTVWGKTAFLTTYPRLRLHIIVTGDQQMKYRIETKNVIRIIGVRIPLVDDLEKNFKDIPAFWQKIGNIGTFTQIFELMNRSPQGMLGVTTYNSSDDISYIIGAASDKPVPDGLIEYQIPALTWAVFQCTGPMPSAFQELYKRFYTEWLPVSDYNYTNGPDMEVYTENDTASPTYKCELWMAVTRRNEAAK